MRIEAEINKIYDEGRVSYFKREGVHYFSTFDWKAVLDFFDKNLNT